MSGPSELPQRQRVAAYAVIVRDGHILLSRLAPYLSATEAWTLPGGGIDFGEHPADAVVREVHEETGLDVTVGRPLLIDSARKHATISGTDMHSVRLVYDGWVAPDAPEPRVVEVDGSTVDARWHPVAAVLSGEVADRADGPALAPAPRDRAEAAGRGVRPGPPRRRGAADPQLRARAPARHLDPAGRRRRAR